MTAHSTAADTITGEVETTGCSSEPLTDIIAPFTEEQVRSLNAFQLDGRCFYSFTCLHDGGDDHSGKGRETKLVAAPEGWYCPYCDYRQGWAFAMMANWDWKRMQDANPLYNGEFLAAAVARETRTQDVLQEVRRERERQTMKWGVQDLTLHAWMSVLTEEVGEAAQEANKTHWSDGGEAWRRHAALYREELVQVAAVAVAAIENLERGAEKAVAGGAGASNSAVLAGV